MIRVQRGNEPADLAAARTERLPRAFAAHASGTLTRAHLLGYEVVKPQLWRAQHHKCAYCESPVHCSYEDVEHFRPKHRVRRETGEEEQDGYWWLTWTWSNLLFGCPLCNRSYKRTLFPLLPESVPLEVGEAAPGGERPLFVDPADPQHPDPIDLIRYVPVKGRWQPTGRDGNERGRAIVRLLGLDAPERVDRYDKHVADHLQEDLEGFHAAVASGDLGRAAARWAQLVRNVRAVRPFTALSYDVIDHHVPRDVRDSLRLVLPRPS